MLWGRLDDCPDRQRAIAPSCSLHVRPGTLTCVGGAASALPGTESRSMRTYRPLALLVLPWLTAAPAVAQSVETLARKQATAMLAASGAVRVDGRLNEEVWALAKPVTDFLQAEPVEGAPPDDPMEVRLVYNDDALFVGARMFSRNPADIQAPMSRRDEGTAQAEHIFVSLDTYLDRRTAYTFGVTAAGVRFDH